MLTALGAAVIAAVASLVGVTLGALVEPLKLNAARRSKLRQDRADRCGRFIEAGARARQHLVSINVTYRQDAGSERLAAYEDEYYTVRAEMRSLLGLLVMSGPEELVEAAREVRRKDMDLHHVRHEPDDGGEFTKVVLPKAVRDAVVELDRAIEAFALVARKHTS
ncbi:MULTISPECIES: hypothetical protein [unclassified Amycolatopsis]|uniref:hypothetical protein n=1 Tax=unclassified Amycolatopsis TaxID=2618356 RepID=UPI0028759AFF|nr:MULTISPECIES: hypothetical protein [unclassified Amycolatopsis]MDS0137443.1 hypothetical protein [Amycolatopsis sp. 505]MDS0141638.1 hypothetical protein [Amycolatopsis sp. CM201R]